MIDDQERKNETASNSTKHQNRPTRRGLLVFCPHRVANSVTEIDAAQLKEQGIQGVILDLDNTLVSWAREDLSKEILDWIQSLRDNNLNFCLLSNSVISKRVDRVAQVFGCTNIRKARKPSRDGFHRAMKTMNTVSSSTAIIGDQMFTDIWGGNRVGIYTIMVKPMSRGEFIYTRYVSRPPERILLKYFKKRGHL